MVCVLYTGELSGTRHRQRRNRGNVSGPMNIAAADSSHFSLADGVSVSVAVHEDSWSLVDSRLTLPTSTSGSVTSQPSLT